MLTSCHLLEGGFAVGVGKATYALRASEALENEDCESNDADSWPVNADKAESDPWYAYCNVIKLPGTYKRQDLSSKVGTAFCEIPFAYLTRAKPRGI